MKSIYDNKRPAQEIQDDATDLELMVRNVRNALALPDLQLVKYERKLLQFVDKSESKLDNAAIMLLSYFSGSIISQNRPLYTRVAMPIFITLGMFGYLMPRTATNIFKEIKNLI